MDLRFTPEEDAFRKEVRAYLDDLLHGGFAEIRGRGGPGDEHVFVDERMAWERQLGAGGWTCVGWPVEYGGQGLPLHQEVRSTSRSTHGPADRGVWATSVRVCSAPRSSTSAPEPASPVPPRIRSGGELWCQGYSEPNAGSDLANVQTRAE